MLPIHTIFGDSDTSSKGVSYNLGLSWEALSAASFDWLIQICSGSKLKRKKHKETSLSQQMTEQFFTPLQQLQVYIFCCQDGDITIL